MSLTKLIWQTSGSNTKSNDISKKILDIIDDSIQEQNKKKEKRSYLGASSLGDPCSRKIQYRYMGVEPDVENQFSSKVLRIFEFGHVIEDMAHGWIYNAGFDLKSTDKNGEQFGFSIADDVNETYLAAIWLKFNVGDKAAEFPFGRNKPENKEKDRSSDT